MSNWQEFLEAQGATRLADGSVAFSGGLEPPGNTATWLTELGHQSLLHFEGPDAETFLQGQVTCDLRELAHGHWLLGAQCNLKGRVIASFTMARQRPDSLLLRTSADLLDTLNQRLEKYAVFSRVTLTPVQNQWRLLGLNGPDAGALIEQHTGLVLDAPGASAATDSVLALRLDDQRYELWVTAERAQPLWLTLAETCQLADTRHWRLTEIDAGRAQVVAATSETFTPQDLNYQLLGAVSFKKGCYTGQEVVARLHYKGKLKKHLYRIAFASETEPAAGTDLVDEAGKARGQIVQAAKKDADTVLALAVLPKDDSRALHAGEQKARAQRLDLPYDIPKADN